MPILPWCSKASAKARYHPKRYSRRSKLEYAELTKSDKSGIVVTRSLILCTNAILDNKPLNLAARPITCPPVMDGAYTGIWDVSFQFCEHQPFYKKLCSAGGWECTWLVTDWYFWISDTAWDRIECETTAASAWAAINRRSPLDAKLVYTMRWIL